MGDAQKPDQKTRRVPYPTLLPKCSAEPLVLNSIRVGHDYGPPPKCCETTYTSTPLIEHSWCEASLLVMT